MDEIEAHQRDSTQLAVSIREEIKLQQLPLDYMKWSIYRVPKRLFNMKPIAYTPQVISIGPFHHGQKHLMAMERHKLQALDIYLSRANMRIEDAIDIAKKWEMDARGCYAEPINDMDQDDFVKMMLVDGCFLVEFMILVYHNFSPPHQTQSLTLDCSFYEAMRFHLCYDLIMLENQLPLFVLKRLFNNIQVVCEFEDTGARIVYFMEIVQNFLEFVYFNPYNMLNLRFLPRNPNHLVHLLSSHCKPQLDTKERENDENEAKEFLLPPTLTKLWEAGVIIKKAAQEKHSMDISFKDGVLEIPHFEIDDHFEIRVRNLMAFEYYRSRISQRYVTNYILFLDGLISTEKDANLLEKAEILTNSIGGCNGEVSKLFNDLCKGITFPSHYYYHNVTKDLTQYCKKTWPRWMASLRRDYFHTPWALISIIAATFLILLTLIQTLYSYLSYVK